jgi:hypothetical protein
VDTSAKKDAVTVSYNGGDKIFEYTPEEKVRAVLDRAISEFRITANPHLMGLFTEGNAELPDDATMSSAGVKPGELLILRQSTFRGGAGGKA